MFFDDLAHVFDHAGVLVPLEAQGAQNLALGFAVDDVDFDLIGLQEAVDAMHRLNEVVELVADAEKDGFVAMVLQLH